MNYLYSKRDLASFSKRDLDLLAEYYNIYTDDRNDFLWLLSIAIHSDRQYAEMPPGKAWDRYSEQLLAKFKTDQSAPKDADKLPVEIINADPSPPKKYLEWIIKSYLDGGIKLFEDMGRIKTALLEYGYLLKKKLITNKFELNISSFCGLSGCKQGKRTKPGLDELLDRYDSELKEMRKAGEHKIAEKEATKVYEDDDLTIITPLTREASCKYGAGTKWCTAAREGGMFESYSKQGPLYILIPKKPNYDREKYQLHVETDSIMNEQDAEVSYAYIQGRFPTIKNVKRFDALGVRDILPTALSTGDVDEIKKLIDMLTTLNLASNSIGDKGAIALARALAKNKTLTKIDLATNSIGEEGVVALARALAKNTTLTNIDLGNNSISGKSAVAMANALVKNKTLTDISLGWNELGDEGTVAMANALVKNNTLTTLNLPSNSIGDEGAIALAHALEKNATVTRIYLYDNSIGNEGAIALAHALEKNATVILINLSENYDITRNIKTEIKDVLGEKIYKLKF